MEAVTPMKLIHLSDLHLGKRLIEVSMLEDQAYILKQIVAIAAEERPDAVLIAGDVYDRSNPPAEAMALFSDFVRDLSALGCAVLIVSGNHDSPERVAYMRGLLSASGVHISPVYDGHIEKVTLTDGHGPVDFHLMPFIQPEAVRPYFPQEKLESADDAARLVLAGMEIDPGRRNVILSHQCILGSSFDEKEQRFVGTLDNVNPAHYAAFDYVALGHIHRAQTVGRADGTMRYCGTPLKYSKKEANADKTIDIVVLGEKGDVQVNSRKLTPLREMRLVRGLFDDLLRTGPAPGTEEDFYFVTLTDEDDPDHAAARLREVYKNLLALDYDNSRTRAGDAFNIEGGGADDERTDLELVMDLFRLTHGTDMSDEARAYVESVIREMEGMDA